MTIGTELRQMLRLAAPVVLAEIGWVSMAVVDIIVVGPLGPAAIGAVGIGSLLFQALAVFGMGLLLGLDTLVSHAYGAGRLEECHRWLLHGLTLAGLVAPVIIGVSWVGIGLLPMLGFSEDVLHLVQPYLRILVWSLFPLLAYAAFRRYLQALGIVMPITIALVSANVINAVAAWALVYGHLGLPALGPRGSGLATLLARLWLAGFLLAAVVRYDRAHHVSLFDISWKPKRKSLSRLLRLSLPAAGQMTLELGVFAAASALAARLDAVSLASHQITFNLASVTFMVPLGIASAGAVRVGHAVGRRDAHSASLAGSTALVMGAGFMAVAACAFVAIPGVLFRFFTGNHDVIALGARLLLVAAMFQMFDGLQGVATGVLRGLGDTRTPMLTNLAGHWFLGLPLGYVLCFPLRWGIVGLWLGLSAGLISVGIVLVFTWRRRVGALARQLST